MLYVLASIGCASATSVEALAGWRALQAFGACGGLVMSRAIVRDRFEVQDAAWVFSLLMLVMGVAPIVAPLLGGWVLMGWGWPAIFASLAGFGAIVAAAVAVGLPESLPPEARVRLGFGEVARVYARLLGHRPFMLLALAGCVAQAGMFAYIAGSPYVFITLHGVPAARYGWLFGLNALGLIATSQVNGLLLGRWPAAAVLRGALGFAAVAGLALLGAAWTGLGGFPGLLVALFAYVASLGLVVPNAMATALGTQTSHHGQASAMFGTIQFGAATLAASLVGALQDGTALPMAGTIAGCGLVALTCCLLTGRTGYAPAPSPAEPASR
jgi:DHA1 family bicyclomycin/chloramphenicol resistance-like MFS transporter